MMNHTPLPWTFEKENNAHQYIKTPFYIRAGDYLIAVGGLQAEATMDNARLIVQACNSHAELLEALEELQKGIYDFASISIEVKNFVYRITTEAIRKANDTVGYEDVMQASDFGL